MLNSQLYRRWYPSSARISDGSQIIFGGALAGGFNDIPDNDNPTVSGVLRGIFPALTTSPLVSLSSFHPKVAANPSIASFFWMLCLRICFPM